LKSSKILFTTALLAEAMPVIERYNLKITEKKPFKIYKNSDISLIISGIGKINSAVATTFLAKEFQNSPAFVNIGICSSKQKEKLYKLYPVKSVTDFATSKKFMLKNRGESLLTVDKEVSKGFENLPCSLIDMESSGFFLAARVFTDIENIKIFKVVSDHLDSTTPSYEFVYKLIKENMEKIEEMI